MLCVACDVTGSLSCSPPLSPRRGLGGYAPKEKENAQAISRRRRHKAPRWSLNRAIYPLPQGGPGGRDPR
jgi:hypothetical protein